MRAALLIVAALALSGCQKKEEPPAAGLDDVGWFGGHIRPGRFISVGLRQPGRMWAQVAPAQPKPATDQTERPPPPVDPAAATPEDDDWIIVVMDTVSGEVRQCGDLSGRCISFNPWASMPAAGRDGPIRLEKHAAQLDAEEEAERTAQAEAWKIEARRVK